MYSDKMADLIESYYNDAVADVQSATTVEEVQSAVNNFKSNIDSVKLMNSLQSAQDGESGISIEDVYLWSSSQLCSRHARSCWLRRSMFKREEAKKNNLA